MCPGSGPGESRCPSWRASLRIRHCRQDHKPWQVLIHRAEAVGCPGSDCRVTAEAIAAVHLIHRGGVVDALHLTAAVEAELVGNAGEVLPVFCHVGSRLTGFAEAEGALHEVPLAALHRRLVTAGANKLLEMQLLELGLGVEGVDVRRAAFHHQEDAPLGLGGQLLWTRSKRPRRRRVCPRCGSISLRTTGEITGHHRREGHAAKRGTESVEGITPPDRLALLSAACRRPAFSRHRQTRCC